MTWQKERKNCVVGGRMSVESRGKSREREALTEKDGIANALWSLEAKNREKQRKKNTKQGTDPTHLFRFVLAVEMGEKRDTIVCVYMCMWL